MLYVQSHSALLIPTVSRAATSVRLFNVLKYVCQNAANTPENMNRYWGIMKAKLIAVNVGQNFAELTMLMGTASLTLVMTPVTDSPAKAACIPNHHVLKTGVNTAC